MRLSLVIGSSALLLLAAPARADVVEPGFVEGCTLPNVQASHPGEICVACDTYYAEPMRCDETLAAGHYTQACRSRGASAWSQIGCRPRTADDPPAPPPTPVPPPPPATTPTPAAEPESSGCTIGHASSTSLVPVAIATLLVGLGLRRRRGVSR